MLFESIARSTEALLKVAILVLNEDRELLYSTCSLEPEEVIEWALENFDIKLAKINLDTGDLGLTGNTEECIRFWLNKTKTEGFFIAKLKK